MDETLIEERGVGGKKTVFNVTRNELIVTTPSLCTFLSDYTRINCLADLHKSLGCSTIPGDAVSGGTGVTFQFSCETNSVRSFVKGNFSL